MRAPANIEVIAKRCADGYTWVDARELLARAPYQPVRVLVRAAPLDRTEREPIIDSNSRDLSYRPLDEERALFRIFGALNPTERDILLFANAFGSLTDTSGHHSWERLDSIDGKLQPAKMAIRGDEFGHWEREIRIVKHCIAIWDLVSGAPRRLVDYIQSLPDDRKHVLKGHPDEPALRALSLPILECSAAERPAAATRIVSQLIGDQISLIARYERHLQFEFGFNPQLLQPQLSMAATGLRSAIWLQFAAALVEDKKYKTCQTCGKPFEVEPGVNRASRMFCGSACKLKAFRDRQRRAAQMRASGKSLKQIADAVGSDTKTVLGWLKPKEK